MGTAAAPAVPHLVPLLGSEDPFVRQSAAVTLGEIGDAASPAVPTLRELLRDSTEGVRIAASWALGNVSTDRSIILDLKFLAQKDPSSRVLTLGSTHVDVAKAS